MPRDLVLLDGLADDLLADAVRVDVGRVPGVQPFVVGGFQEGKRLLSEGVLLASGLRVFGTAILSLERARQEGIPSTI